MSQDLYPPQTNGLTDAELRASALDVTLSSTDVTNAGTFAVQAAQSGTWTVTGAGGTFPVTDSGGSLTVDNAGTFAVQAAQSGTWTVTGSGGTFPVTDNSGSLTVDAPVGTPVFVRLSDGSSAISTLPVSLAADVTVVGKAAHDSPASGNPVLMAGRYTNSSISVTDGDVATLMCTTEGYLRTAVSGGTLTSITSTVKVQGDNIHGTAATIYPLVLGGVSSASTPTAVSMDGLATNLWVTRTGVLQIGDAGGSLTVDDGGTTLSVDDGGGSLTVDDGGSSLTVDGTVDTELPAAVTLADGALNPTTPMLGACSLLYNGATWDRRQGKETGTVLSSSGRTTTTFSSMMTSRTARGVVLFLNVTSGPSPMSANSLTLEVRVRDPITTSRAQEWVKASVAVTSATDATYFFEIGEGAVAGVVAGASPSQRFQCSLPLYWDVVVIHGSTDLWTYSVTYQLIP